MNEAQNLLTQLTQNVPYIVHLGLVFDVSEGILTANLPYKPDLIGNPLVPALHGGVIAAMMELTAMGQVVLASSSSENASQKLPKTIDVSIDYLRTGKPETTFARATITKLGRQIANVEAIAWQSDETKPIAKLHGHFLLL
jgi:uncharacterized protein (TIGR00369 family)